MGTEPRLGSKVFYKIGEVSQLTKLPAYVLRFWESEEGHTLEGVKRYWARRRRAAAKLPPREVAKKLRGDLQAILKIIESHSP
jgi:hypothetical protein